MPKLRKTAVNIDRPAKIIGGINMQNKGTILIVDDEPNILGVLEETFSYDYTILPAANGKEALALLEKKLPDMIIADISMPFVDGFELLANIRRQGLAAKIPLLFLTARGQIADMEKGLKLGAYGYMVKPFLPTQLIAKVEEIFDKLKRRKSDKNREQALN
jgi:DNA-binding response OmpR family regulator